MREIELTNGLCAKVDDEHFEYLNQWRWTSTENGSGNVYAARRETVGGKRTKVLMHRIVAALSGLAIDGKQVDHINMDTLDNRAINLRVASHAENQRNKSKCRNNTSGAKGVSFHNASGKWRAKIQKDGKQIHLGSFTDRDEAAEAYRVAAVAHHDQFARNENGRIEGDRGEAKRIVEDLRHRPRRDSTTGYRGVSRNRSRWQASINVAGKMQHLGQFDSPAKAALAFDAAAIKLRGDKARVNFPFLL